MAVAVLALQFNQANVIASQTNANLTTYDTGVADITMPWPGAIIGLAVNLENARTAGTATFKPAKNGTALTLSAAIDGTNTQRNYATQAKEIDQFAAGDRIGAQVTTDAAWAAGVTPSAVVTVYVQRFLSET